MPTYEFRCPDGHEFETFYRTISGAASEAACPVCGKTAERMMSATGFAFKGSGFYLTDYGKNAHRGEAPPTQGGGETASTNGAESSKTDSASTETKPAADKGESAKSPAPAASAETRKTDGKKSEAKATESKPAPAPPKSSSSE
jgi:putative FmdB family regulatory protein